jgi:hypothetical protein
MEEKRPNTARCIADYLEKVTNCRVLLYESKHTTANCSLKQFQHFKNLTSAKYLPVDADENIIYQVNILFLNIWCMNLNINKTICSKNMNLIVR